MFAHGFAFDHEEAAPADAAEIIAIEWNSHDIRPRRGGAPDQRSEGAVVVGFLARGEI
jgi:hypothetical protein